MFSEENRLSIVRVFNIVLMITAVILMNAGELRSPPNLIGYAIGIPTSASVGIMEKSKGWSIFWIVVSLLFLGGLLILLLS